MVRRLELLAAVLVVTGAFALAVHSGSFSQVTADREVSGAVASNPEAYLAIGVTYGGGTVTNWCFWGQCFNLPVTIAELENRYAEDYDALDVQIVAGPTDVLEIPDAPGELAVGATAGVGLACTGDAAGSGTTDVVLEFDASGATIDVDDARATVQNLDYDCSEP